MTPRGLWDDLKLDNAVSRASRSVRPAELRRRATCRCFGLPGFYTPRIDSGIGAELDQHFYDTAPLNADAASIRLLRRDQHEPSRRFCRHGGRCRQREAHGASATRPKAEARAGPDEDDAACRSLRATSGQRQPGAAVSLDGDRQALYWDGGLVDNTPLGDRDRGVVRRRRRLSPARGDEPLSADRQGCREHDRRERPRARTALRQPAAAGQQLARRINELVETIEGLAKVTGYDGLIRELRARIDEARRYTVLDAIVNIDMQDRLARQPRDAGRVSMTSPASAISRPTRSRRAASAATPAR